MPSGSGDMEEDAVDEFDRKLDRSLGMLERTRPEREKPEATARSKRNPRERQQQDEDEEDEDDDE